LFAVKSQQESQLLLTDRAGALGVCDLEQPWSISNVMKRWTG